MSVTKQRSSSTATERRHDVAKSASLWNATVVDAPAAKRRIDVAMVASPWNAYRNRVLSSEGTTGTVFRVAPLGLRMGCWLRNHGLAPMATTCRPVGTIGQWRMPHLVAEVHAQFAESAKLEQAIKANLTGLGFNLEKK